MFSPPLSCFASISPPLFFFTPLPFKIAHNGVVPPTLRTTVLNLYWQTFVLIFGFVVSFVCLCLVSIWEYRLDNLRVFFGLPTASLGMLSSACRQHLFFIVLHPVFAVKNTIQSPYIPVTFSNLGYTLALASCKEKF